LRRADSTGLSLDDDPDAAHLSDVPRNPADGHDAMSWPS
jgi:hypothetical protein